MEKSAKVTFYLGQWISFLPFIVFLASIAALAYFKAISLLAMAAFAVFGLIVTSLFSKDANAYWDSVMGGIISETTGIVVAIFLVVSIFSQLMVMGQISGGFIWISDIIGLHGAAFTVFVFIASALFGTATGSSVGTIVTMIPILYPAGVVMGANPAMVAGAILSGAAFGDNIAPISDITIISASSQQYATKNGSAEIGPVVRYRMKYTAIAAIASIVLFGLFGGGSESIAEQGLLGNYAYPKGLIMILPAAIVIYMAMKGKSIFSALTGGIVSGFATGLISGVLTFQDIFKIESGSVTGIIVEGVSGIVETLIIFIVVMAMYNLLLDSGIIDRIIARLGDSVKSPRGCEVFILIFSTLVNFITAGITTLTAAIAGPLANSVGRTQHIHPYRRANLISSLANTSSYFIPWSISLFLAISLITGMASVYTFVPIPSVNAILPTVFYPLSLFVVMLVAVFGGFGRIYEGDGGKVEKDLKNVESTQIEKAV